MSKLILKTSALIIVIAVGIFGYLNFVETSTPSFGATGYNPTGGGTYRLQSSVGSSNTSITLSSFKEPISNIKYTMSYLNSSIEYGTLEPQSGNREFISFTGITQNGDGTAILTGVQRGLSSSYPFTASSTLQLAHPGQSIFIISNSPAFYANQFLFGNQTSTSTAILVFSSTTPPRYDSTAAQQNGSIIATTSEFASVAFVQAIAFSGASNAAEGTKGIVDLATALQQASSTSAGVSSSKLVLQSKYATDTPQSGCAVGYTGVAGASCSVIAQLSGKIRQTWLNLTETFTWTALHTFSGGLTSTGTTTISASNINTNPFVLNTLAYTFFGTRAASSSVLTENGSGSLRFITPQVSIINANTAKLSGTTATATTTLDTIVIPANALVSPISIVIARTMWEMGGGDDCGVQISYGDGSATSTLAMFGYPAAYELENVNITLMATSSSSVVGSVESVRGYRAGSGALAVVGFSGPATVNTANVSYISLGARSAGGGSTCKLLGWSAKVERN